MLWQQHPILNRGGSEQPEMMHGLMQLVHEPGTNGYRTPAPVHEVLVIESTDGAQREVALAAAQLTIGRVRQNDIVLTDTAVSRQHLRLERQENAWYLVDLGSTNGVFLEEQRIAPNRPTLWPLDQTVRVGSQRLQRRQAERSDKAEPVSDRAMRNGAHAVATAEQVAAETPITLSLSTAVLALAPGENDTLQMEITNHTDETLVVRCWATNIPLSWVTTPGEPIGLAPRQRVRTPVVFALPFSGTQAGAHDFQIMVESIVGQRMLQHVKGTLKIEPFDQFDLKVIKESYRDGRVYELAVRNTGNRPNIYQLQADDVDDALRLRSRQWQIALTPDTEDAVRVFVQPRARPWLGRARQLPIRLRVSDQNGDEQVFEDTIAMTPTLSPQRLLWLSLIVIAIIALVLLVTNLANWPVLAQARALLLFLLQQFPA